MVASTTKDDNQSVAKPTSDWSHDLLLMTVTTVFRLQSLGWFKASNGFHQSYQVARSPLTTISEPVPELIGPMLHRRGNSQGATPRYHFHLPPQHEVSLIVQLSSYVKPPSTSKALLVLAQSRAEHDGKH
ncbi:hypothetical protein BP5796_07662 [Coleophoma crateriformis]|uniref:Uncharacterized protein n=1 Tax=Coleophoma crateriformis TaxID=565419 RepID=A0A3D8RJS2_9HELO|nr:hypothetical protein BP5796_07662 [Coleophoma crateriformis]